MTETETLTVNIRHNPSAWLFYHIVFKGFQAGSIVGIATFVLRLPFVEFTDPTSKNVKNVKQNEKTTSKKPSKLQILTNMLQRSVFYGTFHAGVIGSCVATFWIFKLTKAEIENRVQRILNAPAQNQVDYLALLCSMIGMIYGWILLPYDPNNDPFIKQPLFQKRILTKNYEKIKRRIDQIEETSEEQIDNTKDEHESIYKTIFTCSWLNPQIRHVLSFAFIGVGVGVILHVVRTKNIVNHQRIITLTINCGNM